MPINPSRSSATDPDTLPPPAEFAAEIVDSVETALEKFRLVAAKLTLGQAGPQSKRHVIVVSIVCSRSFLQLIDNL